MKGRNNVYLVATEVLTDRYYVGAVWYLPLCCKAGIVIMKQI